MAEHKPKIDDARAGQPERVGPKNGDSNKREGDKLRNAAAEAAKRKPTGKS